MNLKSLLLLFAFLVCLGWALLLPEVGVYGYVADYCIGPSRKWWGAPLAQMGVRFSFFLAVAIGIGLLTQWRKIRQGSSALYGQELLFILFVAIIWLGGIWGAGLGGVTIDADAQRYLITDAPSVKMTKVAAFILMMTHIFTEERKMHRLVWCFVLVALFLGVDAWMIPKRAFQGGRLEGLGGADFTDSNRFGGFMGGMLFFIGIQFLRVDWKKKIICFLAGGFAANAVILTRSRGALLGVVMGIFVAAIMSPRKHRAKILAGVVVAALGLLYLSDPQVKNRATTITASEEQRDESAQSRLEIWKGGVAMLMDNPLGVGPGNFYWHIGRYAPDHPYRDAHNTFVRCAGELGFPGLFLLIAILLNAVRLLVKVMREAGALDCPEGRSLQWISFGSGTCLTAVLTYGMTGTLVYTEFLWWFLLMPVCLNRALENARLDLALKKKQNSTDEMPLQPSPSAFGLSPPSTINQGTINQRAGR